MLDRVRVPDGDVFVHAGDGTNHGRVDEVYKFAAQLKALPHKHKVVIAGNHDWLFFTKSKVARRIMREAGVTYLQDSETTIDGVCFYGSPWQPEFCSWAFNLPRGRALAEKWALIPSNTDVLITHGPPWGERDQVRGGEHLGCEMLRAAVNRVWPKVHVFGHIHDGYGVSCMPSRPRFINASICTERYQPTNAPIEFDVEARATSGETCSP